MSEEGADFALWGDETEAVEDQLEIPEDLRRRMKAWAKEDSDRMSGMAPAWTEEWDDHDRRGYHMSQELQAILGETYFRYERSTYRVGSRNFAPRRRLWRVTTPMPVPESYPQGDDLDVAFNHRQILSRLRPRNHTGSTRAAIVGQHHGL